MPEESKVIGMEKAGCWMMGLKKLCFPVVNSRQNQPGIVGGKI